MNTILLILACLITYDLIKLYMKKVKNQLACNLIPVLTKATDKCTRIVEDYNANKKPVTQENNKATQINNFQEFKNDLEGYKEEQNYEGNKIA